MTESCIDLGVATVDEVWRYPVKSMGGERLPSATVGPAGIEGDRAFGLIDGATGKVLSAKTVPLLLSVDASWSNGVVSFSGAIDGRSSDDPDIAEQLSEWLGRNVRLERPAADVRTPYDLPLDPDRPDELFESYTPPGSFFDSRSTLHLLSDASLRSARLDHPAGDWHPRRFRANVLIRTDVDGFPEEDWVGSRVRIGTSESEVRKPAARCVLTTQAQPGLPRDVEVFRSLARNRGGNLGIYLDPRIEGVVTVGDALDVVVSVG